MNDYHAIPGGKKKLEYLSSLLERMKKERPALKVLDVGCGNGNITFALAVFGCGIVGVDVNAASIEHARRSNRHANVRFEIIPGDVFDLGETYDLIVCSEVLEHLVDPQILVNTMVRHLKADGTLLITVPNGYGPREVLGRIEIFLRRKVGLGGIIDGARRTIGMMDHATKCAVHTSNPDQDHIQKFTIRELRGIFARTGLSIVEVVNSIFIFGVIFSKSRGIDRADGRFADFLPHGMASGWYLVCRRNADVGFARKPGG